MITIVSGTNRKGSNSIKIALAYQQILAQKGVTTRFLSLENIELMQRDAAFAKIEQEVIIPATEFIFIVPEYNGSFPGVLKMLFDTSKSHDIWFYKKALLTGVATGRAGNLRGMDHLADILNYLKITVHPNKLPISAVNHLLDESGNIKDADTIKMINDQLDEFLNWIKYT